jgi:hypothetical protein
MLNSRSLKIPRTCKGCGSVFEAYGLGRGNKGHCSERCRFKAKVAVCGPNECWEWAGSISGGYGTYRYREKTHKAHRVAFAVETGSWPQGVVMHTCDNPKCCNPAHLRVGTHQENMTDMKQKGRARSGGVGSSCKLAKLNERAVAEILSTKMQAKDICSRFGIGKSAAYSVLARRTWKHVEAA